MVDREAAVWTAHEDAATRHVYYLNSATGETQWEPPPGVVVGGPAAAAEFDGAASLRDGGGDGGHREGAACFDGEAYEASSATAAVCSPDDAPAGPAPAEPAAAPAEPPAAAAAALLERKQLRRRQNKDYVALAQTYARERPFRALGAAARCCMCQGAAVEDVLFPCEHKCVCRGCMKQHGIGESRTEGAWAFCPLCCGEIKRVLPARGGPEVEEYWTWVMEIRPTLPDKFAQRFEFAGAYLRQPADAHQSKPGRLFIPMGALRRTKKKSAACAVS
ncbi:hypothetical protein M885DRAFT_617856 [Pelagophyceae sp. CCMP2097]|nr:hypothetical protein M885DRAFT_617856 [Pelagophyceae sp. CCMP2097]